MAPEKTTGHGNNLSRPSPRDGKGYLDEPKELQRIEAYLAQARFGFGVQAVMQAIGLEDDRLALLTVAVAEKSLQQKLASRSEFAADPDVVNVSSVALSVAQENHPVIAISEDQRLDAPGSGLALVLLPDQSLDRTLPGLRQTTLVESALQVWQEHQAVTVTPSPEISLQKNISQTTSGVPFEELIQTERITAQELEKVAEILPRRLTFASLSPTLKQKLHLSSDLLQQDPKILLIGEELQNVVQQTLEIAVRNTSAIDTAYVSDPKQQMEQAHAQITASQRIPEPVMLEKNPAYKPVLAHLSENDRLKFLGYYGQADTPRRYLMLDAMRSFTGLALLNHVQKILSPRPPEEQLVKQETKWTRSVTLHRKKTTTTEKKDSTEDAGEEPPQPPQPTRFEARGYPGTEDTGGDIQADYTQRVRRNRGPISARQIAGFTAGAGLVGAGTVAVVAAATGAAITNQITDDKTTLAALKTIGFIWKLFFT